MAQILDEENSVVEAAATRMVALGSLCGQQNIEGEESDEEYEEGFKILKLLKAYRKRDDLTSDELAALLYCLKRFTDEEIIPSLSPLVGQPLSLITLIPRGATGPTGATGARGATGPTGGLPEAWNTATSPSFSLGSGWRDIVGAPFKFRRAADGETIEFQGGLTNTGPANSADEAFFLPGSYTPSVGRSVNAVGYNGTGPVNVQVVITSFSSAPVYEPGVSLGAPMSITQVFFDGINVIL